MKPNLFVSSPVYDFIFVQFVVGPAFVVAWRGTWKNADSLFDDFICHGNLKMAAVYALSLGISVSALILYFQHEIKVFALSGGR